MTKEDVVKRTVYEFKKFARQHKFWEEYKHLSVRLGYRTNDPYVLRNHKQVTFVQLVEEVEPVTLIQGASSFCTWPTKKTNKGEYWAELSKEWAYFCLTNGLVYVEEEALKFVKIYVSRIVYERYLREKRELSLKFK